MTAPSLGSIIRPHQLQEGIFTVRTSAIILTGASTLCEDYMSSHCTLAERDNARSRTDLTRALGGTEFLERVLLMGLWMALLVLDLELGRFRALSFFF